MSYLPTPQVYAFSKQHELKKQETFKMKETPQELKEYSQSHIPMKTEHKLKPPPTYYNDFEENDLELYQQKKDQLSFLEGILKINHHQIQN